MSSARPQTVFRRTSEREASERHLGENWETSGRHLGGVWKTLGRHLGTSGPRQHHGGKMGVAINKKEFTEIASEVDHIYSVAIGRARADIDANEAANLCRAAHVMQEHRRRRALKSRAMKVSRG